MTFGEKAQAKSARVRAPFPGSQSRRKTGSFSRRNWQGGNTPHTVSWKSERPRNAGPDARPDPRVEPEWGWAFSAAPATARTVIGRSRSPRKPCLSAWLSVSDSLAVPQKLPV